MALGGLLGGSWVVISGVTSRVTIFMTHVRGLITPLIWVRKVSGLGLWLSVGRRFRGLGFQCRQD